METAIDHYLREAGVDIAIGFIDSFERACQQISEYPATGSSRYAHELNLPGLRSWPLKTYPYLIFYIERDDGIDIWRVLHGERDIPAWMQRTEDGISG